jgi:hypothetical protein
MMYSTRNNFFAGLFTHIAISCFELDWMVTQTTTLSSAVDAVKVAEV